MNQQGKQKKRKMKELRTAILVLGRLLSVDKAEEIGHWEIGLVHDESGLRRKALLVKSPTTFAVP